MRTGVTASATAHLALILVAIIGLNFAHALPTPPIESISVDLVPLTDTANVRLGSEKSKVLDTPAPAIVDSQKPATLAQPTGNTDQDQPKPAQADTPTPKPVTNSAPQPAAATPTPQPQPKPTPVVPAPPPPPPPPQPAPQPKPTPTPTPPAPKPTPAPTPKPATPTPQLAADSSTSADSAPPVPAPSPPSADVAQKRADLKKQQDAAQKAAEAQIAKAIQDADSQQTKDDAAKVAAQAAQAVADAKAAQAKKDADAKAQAVAQQAAKAADEINSIINQEKTTGAKTGQGGSTSAGKLTGTAATLSQNELAALGAKIGKCWTLLPNEIEAALSVEVLFDLNPDGSVSGEPRIVQADSSDMGQSVARAAQRAIRECQPYKLDPSKYDAWKQVDVTLFTSDQ